MKKRKLISITVENTEPKVDPEVDKEIMEETLMEMIKVHSTEVLVGKGEEDIVEITVRTEAKEGRIKAKVTAEVEEKVERDTEEETEPMKPLT